MQQIDIHKIQAYLKRKEIEAEYQPETGQLYVVFKISDQEYPLFIRLFEGDEILQLLAFLPCSVQPNAMNDTARLLHLLNKELDTPGFGMDEDAALLFYRVMIPIYNKELNPILLDAYIGVIQMVCKTFAAVIAAVALGAVPFEEVVAKAKEATSKQSVTPSKTHKKGR